MTRIKVCGLRREEDAWRAAELGVDFLGFVLAESPRRAAPGEIRPWLRALRAAFPGPRLVGVFVRPAAAEVEEAVETLGLDLVQVHGLAATEPFVASRPVIRACGVGAWRQAEGHRPWAVLVDAADRSGGTGRAWGWAALADDRPARLFVAGGLGADNVAAAIRALRPYAVDASSRLESEPGCKDATRMAAFVSAVREVDRQWETEGRAP